MEQNTIEGWRGGEKKKEKERERDREKGKLKNSNTTVLGENIGSDDTRVLWIPGLFPSLSNSRPGRNHSVFSRLSTHNSPITIPLVCISPPATITPRTNF